VPPQRGIEIAVTATRMASSPRDERRQLALIAATVVALHVMTAVVAMAAQWMTPAMPFLQGWGRLVGTTISGVFLYGIALAGLEEGLGVRGILSRCRGVFRIVSRPWQTVLSLPWSLPRACRCSMPRSVAPVVAGYSVIGMVLLTWVTGRQERLQC
jgi:high-affinity nickel permease